MNQIIKTLLYEWQERRFPQGIERETRLEVLSTPGVNNATVVTGFRRTGKTYLFYQTIEKLLKTLTREEVVYLNFEDERILKPSTEMLTDLIPEIQALYGKKPKYLFLDELQLIAHWSKWVRRILDTETIQIFITGSSSKMSSAELPTELRGRAWEINLTSLTFKEFLRFKQKAIDVEKLAFMKNEAARFRWLFDEYLTFGALPAVVLTAPEKKQELLQAYFQTVVQRDISERHRIDNDAALKTVLKLLLNSTYITISKLHHSLKSLGLAVGKSTVDRYLAYIETAYFMKELYIYKPGVINQLMHPRKVYFVDTGFMTALSAKFSKNSGRLLENLAFNQLSRLHESIYYYKDDSGGEVDFVIMAEGKTQALYQACFDLSDEDTRRREVKSLLKAGKMLQCRNLSILTLEKPEIKDLPKEIKVISAAEFF